VTAPKIDLKTASVAELKAELARLKRLNAPRAKTKATTKRPHRLLTAQEDRALWVETRLVPGRAPAITLARRRKLEIAYDRMTQHAAPVVARYGQRLSERAVALYAK
jgi:hypothetical protein